MIFHREAISQRVQCMTEIGTMFSVPVIRKCSLTKLEEHLRGPYLDTWLLQKYTDKLVSGADPSYMSYLVSDALPFGVCKSVEILLGRYHFFLIIDYSSVNT